MSETVVHAGAPTTAEPKPGHPSIVYDGKNNENSEKRVLFSEKSNKNTKEVPRSAPDQTCAPSASPEDWATQQQEALSNAISMGASKCLACQEKGLSGLFRLDGKDTKGRRRFKCKSCEVSKGILALAGPLSANWEVVKKEFPGLEVVQNPPKGAPKPCRAKRQRVFSLPNDFPESSDGENFATNSGDALILVSSGQITQNEPEFLKKEILAGLGFSAAQATGTKPSFLGEKSKIISPATEAIGQTISFEYPKPPLFQFGTLGTANSPNKGKQTCELDQTHMARLEAKIDEILTIVKSMSGTKINPTARPQTIAVPSMSSSPQTVDKHMSFRDIAVAAKTPMPLATTMAPNPWMVAGPKGRIYTVPEPSGKAATKAKNGLTPEQAKVFLETGKIPVKNSMDIICLETPVGNSPTEIKTLLAAAGIDTKCVKNALKTKHGWELTVFSEKKEEIAQIFNKKSQRAQIKPLPKSADLTDEDLDLLIKELEKRTGNGNKCIPTEMHLTRKTNSLRLKSLINEAKSRRECTRMDTSDADSDAATSIEAECGLLPPGTETENLSLTERRTKEDILLRTQVSNARLRSEAKDTEAREMLSQCPPGPVPSTKPPYQKETLASLLQNKANNREILTNKLSHLEKFLRRSEESRQQPIALGRDHAPSPTTDTEMGNQSSDTDEVFKDFDEEMMVAETSDKIESTTHFFPSPAVVGGDNL